MKCKVCGKNYHHCGSCDSDWYLDNGYCDRECLEKSEKYEEAQKLFDFLNDNIEPNLKHCNDLFEVLEIITEVLC